VLVGSGITEDNIQQYAGANAFIVGSRFKVGGHWAAELDRENIARLMDRVNQIREIQQ